MIRRILGRVKRFVISATERKAGFLTPETKREQLLALIQSLHPRTTEHELVRLGPDGDGGYLIPDDLEGITACFSPGVSKVSGFELDCAERGMEVFLADHSVGEAAEQSERFHFSRTYVGATTNDTMITLDDWVKRSLPESDGDLLLQMDIEVAEYEALLSATDRLLNRFRIIVVEFHLLHLMWGWAFHRIASRVFEKILQTHTCVHIHPNNCRPVFSRNHLEIPPHMEFTFLRNDRFERSSPATTFPHPLDFDNAPYAPVPLPECWYRAD